MKLIIPENIRRQIFCYIAETTPYEVTGIGTIVFIEKEQSFEISEIFLPRQKVDIAHCSFAPNALHEIIFDLIKDNPARAGDLRFRWHSHAEGKVFWSTIDEADIENTNSDWVVNLVVNQRHEMLARLDLFRPFRVKNIPLEIVNLEYIDPEIATQYRAEVERKVQRISQGQAPTTRSHHKKEGFYEQHHGPF